MTETGSCLSFFIISLNNDFVALDTTSPLSLFNSLTHLTYLTSTSPRIPEIMTMDGGLERLADLTRALYLSTTSR